MISSALAFALLCLLSAARSAPLGCNHTRPLDELNAQELEGSWALVAGSIDNSARLESFRMRESAVINITVLSDSSLHYARSIRQNGQCITLLSNITLEGASFTFTFTGKNISEMSSHFLRPPCPDCLLMKMDVNSGEKTYLYLFSKRRELKEEELDEFRSQAECLNMPQPVLKDPTKELC